METVLNNYEQMILLLGMMMVVAGCLVENVMVCGVGLKSALPRFLVSLDGITGRVDWPEEETYACVATGTVFFDREVQVPLTGI
jgi:hypothetical protein